MKRRTAAVLAVVWVGAVSAIAAGVSLAGPGAVGGDSVYGGGRHAIGTCTDGTTPFCPPGGREFSVDAHATRNSRNAEGALEYANPGTGSVIASGDVTCLNVDGDQAVVGGRVTGGSAAGLTFVIHLEDLGAPGSATRDRVSPVFVLSPAEEPPGFPRSCPDFEEDVGGVGFFEQTFGDVAVNDG
jgi:hypothetical protein